MVLVLLFVAFESVVFSQQSRFEELIPKLRSQDPNTRAEAAKALGSLKDPRAIEPLITALRDEERSLDVQMNVIVALVSIGEPSVTPLIVLLSDVYPGVRSSAAQGLMVLQDPRATDFLIAALDDSNAVVRAHVVRALGLMNDVRAVEPMIHMLRNQSRAVRERALAVLKELTGQALGEQPDRWLVWWRQHRKDMPAPKESWSRITGPDSTLALSIDVKNVMRVTDTQVMFFEKLVPVKTSDLFATFQEIVEEGGGDYTALEFAKAAYLLDCNRRLKRGAIFMWFIRSSMSCSRR
ncbi:MAG: heat repeat-containing PBS lyase [Candidatus Scalindua rubra]|uniref:Heat repeat-containing PBS lyase n=1 Tax=Candidatus Scalindua rubra TaxID=1872076 RepID=A0A1E3XCL0_9BACT|nr:MAG: heat repeat-containing PBS lyase [Candidatus Scalindua rubra]